jgi:hypothetical protein
LSNITDFETLNLGTVAGNTTTTDFANGVTTLIGNTTTNSITVTMTMAQLDALTTITNTNGSSNFNITLTTAGTIDLSSSEVDLSGGAGEIDVLTFAAGANTVRVDATAIADIADNAVAGGTDDILQIEDTSVVTDNVFNDFNTLTSVGSGIDITDAGLDVVRSINGDAGDNTISIGAATEVKTIDISQGGTDTIDTDATEAAGARAIVTGFTAGLGGDIFNSAAETLTGTGNFGATSSLYTHSTSGNLDITTGGTTDIAEVFIITSAQLNTNLTTTAAANDLDGTNLLTAIGGTITATTGDDVLFAVQDTNGNTGIYLASEANDTAITAAEINLIGVLANTGVADLTVNNFTNA